MRRILRAGLYRCGKDVFLYAGILLPFGWGLYCGRQAERGGIHAGDLNVLLCIMVALLSLSIGRKHAEGGFRNMLIKGYGKGRIFLCEFLLGLVAASLMILAFFGGCGLMAHETVFSYFPRALAWRSAVGIFLSLLFVCAVTILLCCLISRRALTVLLNMALVFALWSAGEELYHDLQRKEFYPPIGLLQLEQSSDFTDEEKTLIIESAKARGIDLAAGEKILIPNPDYVHGTRRAVYRWLSDVYPCAQLVRYEKLIGPYFDPRNHWRLGLDDAELRFLTLSPLYTLACIAALGTVGFFAFRRRELK